MHRTTIDRYLLLAGPTAANPLLQVCCCGPTLELTDKRTDGRTLYHFIDTHTHPFNGPFFWTTWVSRYQKGKTDLDFNEARDSGISWDICKSAPRSRQTTMPAPYHSVFYRPDALPATQPTASKHWRHKAVFTISYTSQFTAIKIEIQQDKTNFNGCCNFFGFLVDLPSRFLFLNSVFNNDLFILCILSQPQTTLLSNKIDIQGTKQMNNYTSTRTCMNFK